MGREFVSAMQKSELWEVAAIHDISSQARELARQEVPNASIHDSPNASTIPVSTYSMVGPTGGLPLSAITA